MFILWLRYVMKRNHWKTRNKVWMVAQHGTEGCQNKISATVAMLSHMVTVASFPRVNHHHDITSPSHLQFTDLRVNELNPASDSYNQPTTECLSFQLLAWQTWHETAANESTHCDRLDWWAVWPTPALFGVQPATASKQAQSSAEAQFKLANFLLKLVNHSVQTSSIQKQF